MTRTFALGRRSSFLIAAFSSYGILCACLGMFLPAAPQLAVVSSSAGTSAPADVAIAFNAGSAAVVRLKFTLSFPSSISYRSVSPGAAAAGSGKSVTCSVTTSTSVTVTVDAQNSTPIASGDVAVIRFFVSAAAPCDNPITIGTIEASDASSQSVQVLGISGSITIPPAVPTGLTPPDGSTDLPAGTYLQWPGSAGATSYDLYFGTTNNPPFVINCSGFSPYGYAPPQQNGTTYYWRVVARNACTGASTPVLSFKTCSLLPPPQLLTPADNAVDVPIQVDFSWTPVTGTDKYRLLIGPTPTELHNWPANITSESFRWPGQSGATYYWQVVPSNFCGDGSASTVHKFSICAMPGVPSGLQPAYGATGVPLTTVLSWTPTPRATSYEVSFGTTDYPPVVAEVTGTSWVPPALSNDSVYFWSVSAKNSCGSLFSGVHHFETCGVPRPPSNLSPDSGAVDRPLDQRLSWFELPGVNSYDVYFGPTPSPPLVTNTKVNSYAPSGLLPSTTYHWKVAGRNDCFAGIPSATFSFTTVNCSTVLPTPTGLLPANQSVDRPLSQAISWSPVDGATSYDVYFGESPSPSPVFNTTGTNYSPVNGLAPGRTYYWKIVPHNKCITGTATPVFSFTTIDCYSVPDAPSGRLPASLAKDVALDQTIMWFPATGATSYDLYLGTSPSPPFVLTTTGTSYTPAVPFSASTTYYWKLVGHNKCGAGAPSPTFRFSTICDVAPPAPEGLAPADGALGQSTSLTLSWSEVALADSYDVYFGTGSEPPLAGTTTSRAYRLSALAPGSTYYWKVAARNKCGASVSPVNRFATCTPPYPPGSFVPSPGATSVPLNQDLSWSPSSGASSYAVRFGTADPPPAAGNTSATAFRLGTLKPGTTYYWQVIAEGYCGNVPGPVVSFRTCFAPSGLSGFAPSPDQAELPLSVILSWLPAKGAVSYDVYFGSSSNPPLVSSATSTMYDAGVLQPGHRYYWRITAQGSCGETAGPLLSFTTKPDSPPDAPRPSFPGDGATRVPLITDLVWSPASAASSTTSTQLQQLAATYDVYYGESNPPQLQVRGVQETSVHVGPLKPSTRYYWYIEATNSKGTSSSPVFQFTTDRALPAVTLLYPREVSTDGNPGDSEYTAIALLNLDQVPAHLTATAYGTDGKVISGPDITNPATLDLAAGQQTARLDSELFGRGLPAKKPIGWVRVDSDRPRITGFFLAFDASLNFMDGADTRAEMGTSLILPEIEESGFTQVHAVNANPEPATVTVELLEPGRLLRTERSIPANGSIADLLSDLFPDTTPSSDGYLRLTSTLPIASFENLRRAAKYAKGINGQDGAGQGIQLYAPQYVTGESWRTTISIVNPDTIEATVTLQLFGDDGVRIGTLREVNVPASGKIQISDQNFFLNSEGRLTQGYLRISSNGPKLTGSVSFGDTAGESFGTALPLAATRLKSFVFSQLASNATWYTGIALVNPDERAANVTIDLHDENGASVGSRQFSIPAGQRISELLTQYFPELASRDQSRGYIRINSDTGLLSYAVFGTNTLTVLAAVPPQVAP